MENHQGCYRQLAAASNFCVTGTLPPSCQPPRNRPPLISISPSWLDEDERLRSAALQNARSILSARQRAEEALRKQSEWLRITLGSIGDAVISTDEKGRVTFMNGMAESLTGWTQPEALGRPLPEIFHIVNERSREPVENPALRALQEGTVVGLANHTVLIARDGQERPIDDSAAPMHAESGTPIGAVLVFRDVTERKRAQ
jgi:PAS domain S-box-containing protein